MSMRTISYSKYIMAFVITAIIFGTAIAVNNHFNDKRVEQIRSIEDGISIDILSLETQFDLLQEHSCADIRENSVLSSELESLARKLSYTEQQLGAENDEVKRLKRFYSLLEIKDLLLMRKVSDKCALEPVFLLYFYSNEGECADCTKQGYVLTELAQRYPQLRIYSFDYHLDLSAVKTLISLNDIPGDLPALVVGEKTYTGFQSIEDIENNIPELEALKATASSTEETIE